MADSHVVQNMHFTTPTERLKCGKHPEVPLVRQSVAAKTEKVGKDTIIKAQKPAWCCPQCGVIAWLDMTPMPNVYHQGSSVVPLKNATAN